MTSTNRQFLPTSLKEMQALGWDAADVILVSGDAYIDHPSFGTAVIARMLEKCGLKVAILPQPNWRDDLRDFRKLGKPNLFFGVSSGSMDSMINHYTANLRLRSDDVYTPGGKFGFRPDYACSVYAKILKQLFPDVPVVLGGIEASLRRYVHYDFWSDSLKPSILYETGADLLVYGMGEKVTKTIANELKSGKQISELTFLPQIAYLSKSNSSHDSNTKYIPGFDECTKSKKAFADAFKVIEEESNRKHAARIIQKHGEYSVIVNPPYNNFSQEEIDEPYDLPYTRLPHPRYRAKEPIPAFDMICNSINIHRGCFGGCSFCTISAHQGKFVLSRSEKSIMNEVEKVVNNPSFKGHITDLGGPSANMYRMQGTDLSICEQCKRHSCIFPLVCKNLNTDHTPMLRIYEKVGNLDKVKKVTIGSGVRYDLFLGNRFSHPSHRKYFETLVNKHVSGRLKVAPEHTEDEILRIMRKPSFALFLELKKQFESLNQKRSIKQQLIPYFISAHPGSRTLHMAELATKTKQLGYRLEQVQEFTPTPLTLASVMYYTGIDPYSGKTVYIPKSKQERTLQHNFFFWYKKENYPVLRNYLFKLSRKDLLTRLFGSRK